MVAIRNEKNTFLGISWYRGFEAKEIREVTKDEAKVLLRNPFLVEVGDLENDDKTKRGAKKNEAKKD